MKFVFAGIVLCSTLAVSQTRPAPNLLVSIHKVFIDKMPNDLDTYLRAEFIKQFKGDITIVGKKGDADATVTADEKERIIMVFRDGGIYGRYQRPTRALVPIALQSSSLEQQAAAGYVEQLKRDRPVLR
jgi:hypothetical protein